MKFIDTFSNMIGNLFTKFVNLGRVEFTTRYDITAYDSEGNLKWQDSFENLVVTAGLNALITNTFKTIPGSVAWYIGLKGTGTPVAGDTMGSHSSWSEITAYSEANRQAFTPGTVASGSVDNSASKAVFNINGTTTIYGAFLTSDNTKSGTTGTLYGVGDFSASRALVSGDILNVQVTLTATAA